MTVLKREVLCWNQSRDYGWLGNGEVEGEIMQMLRQWNKTNLVCAVARENSVHNKVDMIYCNNIGRVEFYKLLVVEFFGTCLKGK